MVAVSLRILSEKVFRLIFFPTVSAPARETHNILVYFVDTFANTNTLTHTHK